MFDRSFARTLGLGVLLGLGACGPRFDDAPMAQSAEAPAGVLDGADPEGAYLSLTSDDTNRVAFMGAKVTATREGKFLEFEGGAWVKGSEPVGVELEVDTSSIETEAPKLTQHLANADFLEVKKYPLARFKSSSIVAKSGPKGATHEVTGVMEIRGQRRQLTFPATIEVDGRHATGKARFRFDRQEFGIAYTGKKDDLIRDDALLELELHFAEK